MGKEETILMGLRTLCTMFNREPSEPLMRAFIWGLEDLEESSLRRAFARAITDCKFFPVCAEIRELCGVPKKTDDAILAWGAVRRAIDQHDYTTSVDFGALVNAVVRNLGGWVRLCDLGREELDVWARKEFERIYAAFSEKDPATLHGEALQGAFDGRPGHHPHRRKSPATAGLAAPAGDISDLVRELAESKS